MEAKIARGSLIEADIRLMDRSNGFSFGRSAKIDHDPFVLWSDRSLQVLVLGRALVGKIERRFVLVLDDHDLAEFTLADPAGEGLVKFTRDELNEAWNLGAKKGVKWAGSIWVRRSVEAVPGG
jgi:hypothetical protein